MNQTRPKNLNLFTIRFPLPAIVSILHRISGFVLFLLIPALLWLLAFSLSNDGFATLQEWLANPALKLLVWLTLAAYLFHLIAGIRHLLSDLHLGDTLPAGRITAQLTFVAFFILIILTGIWLW